MTNPIHSPGGGRQFSHMSTLQLHGTLEQLRDRMAHLAARAAAGQDVAADIMVLRDRIGQVEHVLIDRLLRAEQVALSRLREPPLQPPISGRPLGMFEAMPDEITRHHVLPFLEVRDLVSLAEASRGGMSAEARQAVAAVLQELRILVEQYPILDQAYGALLSASHESADGHAVRRFMDDLMEARELLQALSPHNAAISTICGPLLESGSSISPARDLKAFADGLENRIRDAADGLGRGALVDLYLSLKMNENSGSRCLLTHMLRLELARRICARFVPIPVALRHDRDIMLEAIRTSYHLLEQANVSLRRDPEFMLAAVRINPAALRFADATLRANKQIVLEAVRGYGEVLFYADESLKRDRDVVRAAVRQFPEALAYAHPDLQNDPEFRAQS